MSVERIDAYPFSMDGNSLNRIGIRYFLKSSESKFLAIVLGSLSPLHAQFFPLGSFFQTF